MSITTWTLYVFAGLALTGVLLHVLALGLYEVERRAFSWDWWRARFNLSEKAHIASIVVLLAAVVDGFALFVLILKQMAGG